MDTVIVGPTYYHRLLLDSHRLNLSSVCDYEVGSFDFTRLWHGDRIRACELEEVTLFLDSKKILPDIVGNPLSLLILSEKLVDLLELKDGAEVQVFRFPLFRQERGKKSTLDGFRLVNPILRLDCLDQERSLIHRKASGEISSIEKFAFCAAAIPEGTKIFRPTVSDGDVFVFDRLALNTRGKGINGLAFQRCEAV